MRKRRVLIGGKRRVIRAAAAGNWPIFCHISPPSLPARKWPIVMKLGGVGVFGSGAVAVRPAAKLARDRSRRAVETSLFTHT